MIETTEKNSIAEYNPVEAGLTELRRKYANVAVDVSTTKALDKAKRVRAEIREPRYETEKIRKMLKAPALAHAKLIDTEAARITTELLAIETPWDKAVKAEEKRREVEKEERESANRARIIAINARIASIKEYVALALECRTSERIQILQDKLAAMEMTGFEEFETEAKAAWKATGDRIEQILNAKLADEAKRARVKKEQEAAAAKLAAERAEFEAQQAAAKAAADLKQAEETAAAAREKAQRDADAAQLAAARAKFEAEQAAAKELLEAKERKLAADQAALDAQKAPPAPAIIEPVATETVAAAQPEPEPEYREETTVAPIVTTEKTPDEPSDAEIIWTAVNAVAQGYQMTRHEAAQRLADIPLWIV